jgi:hypothetical protein
MAGHRQRNVVGNSLCDWKIRFGKMNLVAREKITALRHSGV